MSAKDRLGPRATAPTVEVNRPTLEVKRVPVDWDAPEDRDTLDLERDVGIVEPIRQKVKKSTTPERNLFSQVIFF